jgi:hypothetical protein
MKLYGVFDTEKSYFPGMFVIYRFLATSYSLVVQKFESYFCAVI